VIKVAVKTLREDMESYSKDELLREGRVMMNLEHDNIVKFIGISWHPTICMVQELMKLGSLHSYLKENEGDDSALLNIPLWAFQVARGMVYLEQKEVVHRDLALRNILLADIDTAKISDFGLSRVLGAGKDYYTASQGGRWPIKWYAPECCSYGTFSHKSDVWSFGITLWEMYSFGDVPYGSDVPGSKVLDMVEKGDRLEKPKLCPLDVYEMMRKCWSTEPDERPSFSELRDFFTRRVKLETFI
jgi:tyrosine-protein kinase